MNILVTGGTGYIGSHTIVELIKAGHYVEIVDNLCNSKISVLDQIEKITGVRPVFHEIDLRDYNTLKKIFLTSENLKRFDAVIHFAGLKSVAESVENPLRYYENNLNGTLNLLRCMAETNIKKLIFSSSATVYGDASTAPYTEDSPTGQGITNPYGKTKYMVEEILKDVARADSTFEIAILRYFNPIGNHESGLLGEEPNSQPNNLMPVIMNVATGKCPELSVYGDDYPTPDGTCIRDYIHVVDLAKAHLAALSLLSSTHATNVNIFNIGTGKGTSVLEMVAAFEKVSGKSLPHKIVARRPGDLAEVFADVKKAHAMLGWQAEKTIDDAMADTLKFLNQK